MAICSCDCKRTCALYAVLISVILGIVAAFLQITGVITVTPAFLWVVLGVAVVYLAILVAALLLHHSNTPHTCLCSSLNALLAGILGAALFALVLLAVGIVATSIVSAILVGILVAFFALVLTGAACLVRCLSGCSR